MNSLKSLAMNCGPLSEMMRGRASGNCSFAPLEQDFDIRLAHGFPQAPVDNVATGSVEDGAQVVERAVDVDMGDVDVPVFMGRQRLLEARSLLGGLAGKVAQPAGVAQYAKNAGRADGDHVGIDHHVRQTAITFQWIAQLEVQDGGLLPFGQPEIAGNSTVVLVDLAVALRPVIILAHAQFQPLQQTFDGQAGLLRPLANEIHDGVAKIRLDPATVQSSPSSFFSEMCSAISSARTSSF